MKNALNEIEKVGISAKTEDGMFKLSIEIIDELVSKWSSLSLEQRFDVALAMLK